jgi:hypothetical protein
VSPTQIWTPPGSTARPRAIADALDDLEDRLTRVDHERFRREWALNTGRSRRGSLDLRLARARLLSHSRLRTWSREVRGRVGSPLLQRRLELLEKQVLDSQLEDHPSVARANEAIEGRISAFQPRWKGRRVNQAEIWDLVSKEPNPALRRDGYYANESLFRRLEPHMRSLMARRNERARELGFTSYPEARLSLEGLSVADLETIMEPLSNFASRLSQAQRDRSGLDTWFPWDRMFAQWQEANSVKKMFSAKDCLPAVRLGLRGWGFGARDLAFRFKRWDTPLAGLAIVGDAPWDVGVIANPRDGYVYYSVLIHEMGHGIHARSVRGSSHLLRDLGPPGYAESIGSVFEGVVSDPVWLRTRPGMTRERAVEIRRGAYEELALRMAELVGEIRTELRLYSNPGASVDAERKAFIERHFRYDDHVPISWVDPYHLSPGFYRPSYILASCFDEQATSAGLSLVGGDPWPNPKFGRWLRETWLRRGQHDEWVPKVREVTGSPLGSDAFMETIRRET